MTGAVTYPGRDHARRYLVRHCAGHGLELGPGHSPYPLTYPGASARYVDRWEPDQNRSLFPELGDGATFPKPHLVANLDEDRLSMVDDNSQDFIIASHVLEHVADPVGLLADMHRALKPGGALLILLPDRRRTFDDGRAGTTVDHVVAEYHRGVTRVDDAHIEEFLRATGEDVDAVAPGDRSALFELHRQRSIHVHCWTEDEWSELLEICIGELRQSWELVEVLNNADVPGSIEFGMVLTKSLSQNDPDTARRRFMHLVADLGPHRNVDLDPTSEVHGVDIAVPPEGMREIAGLLRERDSARVDAENWRVLALHREEKLRALDRSPLGPVLRAAWNVRERRRSAKT